MVFTNRRKWSSNNNDRDDQNQTTTTYKYNKIDINRFLLIGGDNGENNESLNTMNSLWYALTLEPVAVQNERCSKLNMCDISCAQIRPSYCYYIYLNGHISYYI